VPLSFFWWAAIRPGVIYPISAVRRMGIKWTAPSI
jgi:hypothetical protein